MFCFLSADINECEEKAHNCGGSAVCLNTIGSYFCACQEVGLLLTVCQKLFYNLFDNMQGYKSNGTHCSGQHIC